MIHTSRRHPTQTHPENCPAPSNPCVSNTAEPPGVMREHRTRDRSRQAALTPDAQALAARHMGLVGVHLRTRLRLRPRHRSARREFDELFQIGCLALVQAAARYDPERHGPFPAYVLPRIRRAVHAALLAGRSLVRAPHRAGARQQASALHGGAPGQRFWLTHRPCRNSTTCASGNARTCGNASVDGQYDTIRHALRRRFERAARQAGDDLANRVRRHKNAADIFARITAERILVSDPDERTPVRRLAADLGLTSGQVTEYEHRLLDITRNHLRDDTPAHLLVHLAGLDPNGFDGLLDAERRRRILQAQVRQFERSFAAAGLAERAQILYTLVERSAIGVGEVARNLFLLTLPNP